MFRTWFIYFVFKKILGQNKTTSQRGNYSQKTFLKVSGKNSYINSQCTHTQKDRVQLSNLFFFLRYTTQLQNRLSFFFWTLDKFYYFWKVNKNQQRWGNEIIIQIQVSFPWKAWACNKYAKPARWLICIIEKTISPTDIKTVLGKEKKIYSASERE